MYIGDELQEVVEELVGGAHHKGGKQAELDTGVLALPGIPLDNSDRNRTSPFAFTGNKFEFRMPGSSFNIACTNIMLNTAVAEALRLFADELEQAQDFKTALTDLVCRELKNHSRILFNGNGYSPQWEREAQARGLLNYKKTPDALIHYMDEKNVDLFTRHGIYTRQEMQSRQDICLE